MGIKICFPTKILVTAFPPSILRNYIYSGYDLIIGTIKAKHILNKNLVTILSILRINIINLKLVFICLIFVKNRKNKYLIQVSDSCKIINLEFRDVFY